MQQLSGRDTYTPQDVPQVLGNCGLSLNVVETPSVAGLKTFYCRNCGSILTNENWSIWCYKGHKYICKSCEKLSGRTRQKKWRQNNKYKVNLRRNLRRKEERNRVIMHYGGKCACCGESRVEYLTIDHINGKGREHRRKIGIIRSSDFYHWLIKNNYPEGFQVLCFNCNSGKHTYNVCPHNIEKFEKIIKDKCNRQQTRETWKLRFDVLAKYGGKCAICGEQNPYFLTIDHIDGNGNKERQKIGGWKSLYRKLRREEVNPNYRLLCFNCNCALGFRRI